MVKQHHDPEDDPFTALRNSVFSSLVIWVILYQILTSICW